MVEKRPLEGGGDGSQGGGGGVVAEAAAPAGGTNGADAAANKRPKLDGAAPAGAKSLSLEALEKAKKALQLQKELKEKLKNLPQLKKPAVPPASAAPGAAPAAAAAQLAAAAAAATAKAAELAGRFGVSITPAPAALAALTAAAAPPAAAVPTPASASVSVGAGPKGFKAAPLRLDAQGREVDEFGNVVSSRAQPVTTLRVNQGLPSTAAPSSSLLSPASSSFLQAPTQQPAQQHHQQQQYQQEEEQVDASQFFDPRMGGGALKKLNRRARATFDFVQEGELQRQAEEFRSQGQFGRGGRGGPPGGLLPPLPRLPIGPLGVGQESEGGGASREGTPDTEEPDEPEEQVPAVEWWDKGLLAFGSYEQDVPEEADQPVQLNDRKITLYVEHPVPIEPPAEGPPPAPQPLKLTAREVKKLRTQRRLAREKEKQDLIRQGLLEPPKPKVKISNLYRVLGEQAVLDPTAIELETRKQMAERQQAHEDRNMARALTPAERRDKKERKLFDETGLETITSVYRVERMDHSQNRYKVEINAKENRMTGALLITPSFSLVVVEGCNKSTKRYAKLMLRRIDWTARPPPPKSRGQGRGEEGDPEEGMEEEEEDDERPENRCDLVWQGLVKEPAFEKFKAEVCSTVEHAQQVLAQHNVLHYWDAAKNFVPGESAGVTLLS